MYLDFYKIIVLLQLIFLKKFWQKSLFITFLIFLTHSFQIIQLSCLHPSLIILYQIFFIYNPNINQIQYILILYYNINLFLNKQTSIKDSTNNQKDQLYIIIISMENNLLPLQQMLNQLKKALAAQKTKDFLLAQRILSNLLLLYSFQTPKLQNLRLQIHSLRGLVYQELKEYKKAQEDLNFVILQNEFHMITYLRRAELYMKVNNIEGVLSDLKFLHNYEPSIEIKSMIQKLEQLIDQSEENERKYFLKKELSELMIEDEEEQQILLSFCNLKKIDRKSLSYSSQKKQSVFFGQQEIIQIQKPVVIPNLVKRQSKTLTPEQLIKKLQEQQIEQNQNKQVQQMNYNIKLIVPKLTQKKRSILKKTSFDTTMSLPEKLNQQDKGALSALKIKNIEGKLIQSGEKTVLKFRKSQFFHQNQTQNSKKTLRKSILKQTSEINNSNISIQNIGESKLYRTTSSFLRLKEIDRQVSKQENDNQQSQESCKSFDSSNDFNIYGNKSNEIKYAQIVENLFKEKPLIQTDKSKKSSCSKKSVLKSKNSIKTNDKRRTVYFKQ